MSEPAAHAVADPARTTPRVHVAITTAVLDLQASVAHVQDPTAGGIGQFLGVVRNHHAGAAVDHLVYEAFDEQALPQLERVAAEVIEEFTGVRAVFLEHRLGRLEVGDVAVVAAASAPHRDEAIEATRALIDRTKSRVPIWKHEHLADGTTRWPGLDDC